MPVNLSCYLGCCFYVVDLTWSAALISHGRVDVLLGRVKEVIVL